MKGNSQPPDCTRISIITILFSEVLLLMTKIHYSITGKVVKTCKWNDFLLTVSECVPFFNCVHELLKLTTNHS